MVKGSGGRPGLRVTADGGGVVGHAGARLLADLAERLGLVEGLSVAMAPTRQRRSKHDPGRALIDVAVMLADGGTHLSDVSVLRNQPELFGPVASESTLWRAVHSIGPAERAAIALARKLARRRAWAAGGRPQQLVLDIDATLVASHSDKELATPTWKMGFGFHPLLCFLDGTGEALSGMLRPGNAGSNTAADHIEVLDDALAQLPLGDNDAVLVRADSAGCSHAFLDHARTRGVEFSVGLPADETVREAVLAVPSAAWRPAITQDMEERDGAQVAELALDLSRFPAGTRAIARREHPHPGAQLSFTDADGHRFQVFITDSSDADIVYLEARHRGHARVEDRIRNAKQAGLERFPFHHFEANQAWLELVLLTSDLVAWAQQLCLEGDLARAEPKRLRYCLWHTAARLARTGRVTYLRLQATWPWAAQLAHAFHRLQALPI